MATHEPDRDLIERILEEYAAIPVSKSSLIHSMETQTVFDREHDRYLLMTVGWEWWGKQKSRVYSPMIHVDIIDGKFHVQYDGTDRPIAMELLYAGVARERIVLAFHPPELRKYTEFAVE